MWRKDTRLNALNIILTIEYSELATSDYEKLLQMVQDAVLLRKIVIELHREFIECELENIRIGMAIECLCAREWSDKVSVLRDISVDVLENKWTAEEFSTELEKMKTRESEYGSTLRDIKFVAQRVADTMLIYKIMGHE